VLIVRWGAVAPPAVTKLNCAAALFVEDSRRE